MDHVPWRVERGAEAAVPHEVRQAIEMDVERLETAGFTGHRLHGDAAEVGAVARRRDCRDLPRAGGLQRHFVREPAVHRDHIGMADGQQAPIHLAEGLRPSDSPTRSLARRSLAPPFAVAHLAAARSRTPLPGCDRPRAPPHRAAAARAPGYAG